MNENELDLTAIEARLAAITQGKWEYFKEYDTVETSLIETDNQEYYQFIARVTSNGQEYSLSHNVEADGEFIAHAPADIAALVAEVKALRKSQGYLNHSRVEARKETKERILSAIDMAGLMETRFGSKDRARVIAEMKLLVQSI